LVWAPFLLASLLLYGPFVQRGSRATLIVVAAACATAAAGAAYSLFMAQRGIPDIVALTYLVPR
jgi:hypothetical protein